MEKWKTPEDVRNLVIQLYCEDGEGPSYISRVTGLSRPTINKIIGYRRKSDKYAISKSRDTKIIETFKETIKIVKVATITGETSDRVRKVLNFHSIPIPKGRLFLPICGVNGMKMTAQEYNARLIAQGGKCAICGKDLSDTRKGLDHDHSTGMLREFLCMKCNLGLGFVEDKEYLDKALAYLEKHKHPCKPVPPL